MTNINLLRVWPLEGQPHGVFHIKGIHRPTPYILLTATNLYLEGLTYTFEMTFQSCAFQFYVF